MHSQKEKKEKKERKSNKQQFEKLQQLKVRDLCVKNLNAVNITTKTITGATGTFNNLVIQNANINNLQTTNINGRNINCNKSPFNFTGVITPISYIDGQPKQPDNPGNFNQEVLDELWRLNRLTNESIQLIGDSGRLRNTILNRFYGCLQCPNVSLSKCNCPFNEYAVFIGAIDVAETGATGSIGSILRVTEMLDESFTDCPAFIGKIQIGQRIFMQDTKSFNFTIVEQLNGIPGEIGTYRIKNDFNDYSPISSQKMLALPDCAFVNSFPFNECINVPLRTYGIETLSVGPTGACDAIISAISYNLNMANKTLNTRIAAIYVQVGWQVPGESTVNVRGLSVDTRQFDPSILSFGEQMNNNVLLPTNLIESIAIYNRFSNTINAVVQLVVYVEDGLEVLIPDSTRSFRGFTNSSKKAISNNRFTSLQQNTQIISTPTTNYAASFVPRDAEIILDPFIIPEGARTVRFNAFGGGGGGGSGKSFFNPGGGGGGGSGFDLGGEIFIDLTLPGNNFISIVVLIGRGGASDSDGGVTSVILTLANGNRIFGAAGGKKGNTPTTFIAGDGGAGYFGGGGGGAIPGGTINSVGKGGTGSAPGQVCRDGLPGQPAERPTFGSDGGRGGSSNCELGGLGGIAKEEISGGGGGGGTGGGNGGSVDINNGNGFDATGLSAGGGGSIRGGSQGGRGGDGYFIGPFFTF